MFLGIEIGGTKLQLGIGAGDGTLVALERRNVVMERGAAGIREQIEAVGRELIAVHRPLGVGYGFGGPLDLAAGRTIRSHQVAGWDDFPLAAWTHEALGLPAVLNNDCDAAALAEARFGAGAGKRIVFYVTVGTGIGGGLVIDGQIHRGSRGVTAEIGHLRPGLHREGVTETVEAVAAGPGIVASVRADLERSDGPTTETAGDVADLTAKDVYIAAAEGNGVAADAIRTAARTLGWAIAQTITLIAPDVIVIGGGVSLAGEAAFFAPLRDEVARYVFPPLRGAYLIMPAALGEEVVVHGAIAAARDALGCAKCFVKS
jgi:glucokinase